VPSEQVVQVLREKSTIFALLDQRNDGNFTHWLAQRRSDRKSYFKIAMELADEFGVRVDPTTIRIWIGVLGIEHGVPKALQVLGPRRHGKVVPR
jgi:hypothetical protein